MTEPAEVPLRLSAQKIDKHFSVPVLRQVDFELYPGEIHALLGANGAGKSTLSKIISGLLSPSAGHMWLDGRVYSPASKRDAENAGVQIVQQELNLIAGLSVAENLFLNRLPRRFRCIDYRRLHRDSAQALDRVGLEEVSPTAAIESLGVGQQQLVEIAAALSRDCRVLILDEPTAALTSREVDRLFVQLRRLRGEGTGIIYISHRLEEIRTICDRATVLRDGQVVTSKDVGDLSIEEMVRQMVGQSTTDQRQHHSFTGTPALRVCNLTSGRAVRNVSLTLHRGERLGIAGLVGSGRTELLRAIFGADRAESGELIIGIDDTERRLRPTHPRQAVAAGIGLVTEDRKQDGLLMPHSVRINTSLASLGRFRRPWGRFDQLREAAEAKRLTSQLGTRCTSVEQPVAQLSGGNQQKVVVAKWMLRDAEILLLDEPTRGIDVGARQQIYQLIDAMAGRGKAILMVSSDLQELMEICDRIVVISAGRAVAEFARGAWSHEAITAAAFAGYLGNEDSAERGIAE